MKIYCDMDIDSKEEKNRRGKKKQVERKRTIEE